MARGDNRRSPKVLQRRAQKKLKARIARKAVLVKEGRKAAPKKAPVASRA